MHDNMKARLVSGLGHAVPDYVVAYVDRANEFYRRVGYGDAPWQVVPLLVLMAESEYQSSPDRLPRFEGDPPRPPPPNVDMRTREGRALKTAGAV